MAATAADSVCVDQRCACHTDPARKVVTPFPLDAGPPYCCGRCASSRCDSCGGPVSHQWATLDHYGMLSTPRHVLCPRAEGVAGLEATAREILRLRDLIAKQEPHSRAGNDCATCSKMNLEGIATGAAIKFAEYFLRACGEAAGRSPAEAASE